MRDGTAGRILAKTLVLRDRTALLRVGSAVVLRNLLKACRFSAISLVVSIKKRIFAADIMNYNKGDYIMMLGINAPKPLVKGLFAKLFTIRWLQRKIGRNLQQKVLGRLNLLCASYE